MNINTLSISQNFKWGRFLSECAFVPSLNFLRKIQYHVNKAVTIQLKSNVKMPGELKLRNRAEKSMIFRILRGFCGERGIRTPGTHKEFNSFRDCPVRPLRHLSFSQIYAEAESNANEFIQFCIAEAQQDMRQSRIYAEAESNANEFIQFCIAEAQQDMRQSRIYPETKRAMQMNLFNFALPRRNRICGEAEYTQKPKEQCK